MASFGLTFDDYAIPHLDTVRDNFGDAETFTVSMPGMDGGFDQWGTDETPSPVGRVDVSFALESDTAAGMQALIDAVRKLKSYGRRKLYLQPEGTAAQRWCYARVESIDIPRGPVLTTNKYQEVKIRFHVPDPHWYENEATATKVLPTSATALPLQSATIVHNGNAPTLLNIKLVSERVSGLLVNPDIYHTIGGTVVETLSWAGTLSFGGTLTINSRAKSVAKGTASAWDTFTFSHPDWVVLQPGTNVIQFAADAATGIGGASGTAYLTYYPAYR